MIPYYVMYYVKSVMQHGNCVAVFFKKNEGQNSLFHFFFFPLQSGGKIRRPQPYRTGRGSSGEMKER